MATKATTEVRSTERRTIESGRFARALTEPMTVAFDGLGAGVGDVTHREQTYRVELESGVCECRDYEFRGESIVCKHVLRASLAALYAPEQRSYALTARIARFAREFGCEHGVRGCAGPTTRGERGLPCPGCIDAVRAPGVDEWTVWRRLIGPEGERR